MKTFLVSLVLSFACSVVVGPLSRGADVDNDALTKRLVAAAAKGDLDAVEAAVTEGADLNRGLSSGLTPLAAARLHGNKAVRDFLIAKGADAQAPLPAPAALVNALLDARFEKDAPGVTVLAARDGQILFAATRGLADVERHVPITAETKFRIGSITKQFTAASILRLQQAGKLQITDPLSKYYSDFPHGDAITLRHLLTHTSGLHSYTDEPDFHEQVTQPILPATLIASIEKFPPEFAPGAKWKYSNSGYFILGAIVEKVSGQTYGDFLEQTFFEPLGMKSTGVYRHDAPPAEAAVGYAYRKDHYERAPDWDMSWAGGAGVLYSTAEDLYRWNEGVFGHKVLSDADLAAAHTPVVTEENKNDAHQDGYGFGWMISQFRGAREIGHGGGLDGFISYIGRLPAKNFTVVVFINSFPIKPGTAAPELAHEIMEDYLGAELADRPEPPPPVTIPASALAAVVGRYDYGGALLVVTQEGNRLFAKLGGQSRFEILPKSETEFFWKVVDAQVTFVKDANGRVVEAIHHQNGNTFHAPKLEDAVEITLTDAQTEPLLGQYTFGARKLTIIRQNGRLYAQLTGQPKFELGATAETEFFLKAINARLSFVKAKDGTVTRAVLHQHGRDTELPKESATPAKP